MARRAGDTWGNFLARLSPRTTPRPLPGASSSPALTTPPPSSSSSAAHHAEVQTPAGRKGGKSKKKTPTRTRSEDRIDWGKDRIDAPASSSSSSSAAAGGGKAKRVGLRSRSLSPVRRADQLERVGSRKGKLKKRNQ
jgi:hypothetical protein